MATREKPEAKAEATAPVQEVPEVKVSPVFAVGKLRSNCVELFGVTSSTFDGAMYGHDLDKQYSVDEVKKIISAFLNGGK